MLIIGPKGWIETLNKGQEVQVKKILMLSADRMVGPRVRYLSDKKFTAFPPLTMIRRTGTGSLLYLRK